MGFTTNDELTASLDDQVERLISDNELTGILNSEPANKLLNRYAPSESDVRKNCSTLGSDAFNELMPFDDVTTPSFPIEYLPPFAREFVLAASDAIQAPIDLTAVCTLGVLEIACRGRYPVQLPNNHIEQPCLYLLPIAPPSERKSSVISTVTAPLIEYENLFEVEHADEIEANQSELRLLKGAIEQAERTIIKGGDNQKVSTARGELQELISEFSKFESVEPLRLFGADVTPEKLAGMLHSQNGVFSLISGEGNTIFSNINRYCERGGLEIYLHGYSGDAIRLDRKTSASVCINRPILSIVAPCQPSVVTELFDDANNLNRGLLSRILFVSCSSYVGKRVSVSEPLAELVNTHYRNTCFQALNGKTGGNLRFSDQGFEVYRKLFDLIEPQLTPDVGELEYMADWAGKLPGQMARLAGLLHCINAFERNQDPLERLISENEAAAAAALALYFLDHAKAIYLRESEPMSITHAKYLWGRLCSLRTTETTRSRVYRATQNYQRDAFSLDDSLAELEARGYIWMKTVRLDGADKPTTIISINENAKSGVFSVFTPITERNWEDMECKCTKWTQNPNIENANSTALEYFRNEFESLSDSEVDEVNDLFNERSAPPESFEQVAMG